MSTTATSFAILLQDFFCRRLIAERGASAHTVASYRDSFELLLRFVARRTGRSPTALDIEDLDAPLVLAFLDHLETERGNSRRTRNARLTAIRSFMRYVSLRSPTALAVAQRVLAIPTKRVDVPILGHLTRDEIDALLDAPSAMTWCGQRDRVLFAVLYNTGARVSEVTRLCIADVLLDRQFALLLHGKGRKERVLPLWKSTATALRRWLARIERSPSAPLFPSRAGTALSRSGVAYRLRLAVASARVRCPSLSTRRISPHTVRHTTAMHLLQAGVDLSVIALWLGHESPLTTHRYLEADLDTKAAALAKVADPAPTQTTYRATDRLLAFLESL